MGEAGRGNAIILPFDGGIDDRCFGFDGNADYRFAYFGTAGLGRIKSEQIAGKSVYGVNAALLVLAKLGLIDWQKWGQG